MPFFFSHLPTPPFNALLSLNHYSMAENAYSVNLLFVHFIIFSVYLPIFKHPYMPFLALSRRSITSSWGVFPENSTEQFSFTIW